MRRLKGEPVSRERRAAGAGRHRRGRASPCRRVFQRHASAPRLRAGLVGQPARAAIGRADDRPRPGAAPELLRDHPRFAPRRRDGALVVRARSPSSRGRSTGVVVMNRGVQGRRRQHRRPSRARRHSAAHPAASALRGPRAVANSTDAWAGWTAIGRRRARAVLRGKRGRFGPGRPARLGAGAWKPFGSRSTISTPLSRRARYRNRS